MNIYNIYRKLTSQVCCPRDDGKPEWTPWERKEANFIRPVNRYDGNYWYSGIKDIEITNIYQERQCVTCGKFQQEKLKY
jgi:hypothetical protein